MGTRSATGERVLTQAVAFNGVVAFSTALMTEDLCLPAVGNMYALNFGTGQTALTTRTGQTTYVPLTSLISDLQFVSVDGKPRLIGGNQQGEVFTPPQQTVNVTVRPLNWRQVPVSGK
jgi:hypothetical protein